jgi:hypothetical protein
MFLIFPLRPDKTNAGIPVIIGNIIRKFFSAFGNCVQDQLPQIFYDRLLPFRQVIEKFIHIPEPYWLVSIHYFMDLLSKVRDSI